MQRMAGGTGQACAAALHRASSALLVRITRTGDRRSSDASSSACSRVLSGRAVPPACKTANSAAKAAAVGQEQRGGAAVSGRQSGLQRRRLPRERRVGDG